MQGELYHHGIKGQRWGIRRYQNKYGALTPAGKKRQKALEDKYDELDKIGAMSAKGKKTKANVESEYKSLTGKSIRTVSKEKKKLEEETGEQAKKKSLSDMSDDELRGLINRKNLERQYAQLNPEEVSKGKQFISEVGKDVVMPAVKQASKGLLQDFISKKGKELLGIDGDAGLDAMGRLQKEVKGLNLQKQKKELEKYFKQENGDKPLDDSNSSGSEKKPDSSPEPEVNKTQNTSSSGNNYQQTSRSSNADNYSSTSNTSISPKYGNVTWREITPEDTTAGRNYLNQFLLEDKSKK